MPKPFAQTKCAVQLSDAAQGVIHPDELKQIFDNIDARKNQESIENLTREITGKFLDQKSYNAFNQKRTMLGNAQARRRIASTVQDWIKRGLSPAKAFEAYSLGTSGHPGIGTRDNAEARRQTLQHVESSRIATQLRRERLTRYAASGAFDGAIREARWMQNSTPEERANFRPTELPKLNPDQQKAVNRVAELFNQQSEYMRKLAGAKGAIIAKREGYAGQQFHDTYKIRNADAPKKFRLINQTSDAARVTYTSDLAKWIDLSATRSNLVRLGRLGPLENLDPHKFLDSLWDVFATGVRKEPRAGGVAYSGNIATEAEKARILEFKSPAAQTAYDKKYGHGSAWESHLEQIHNLAHTISSLEFFGPSAEENFERVQSEHLVGLRNKLEKIRESENPQAAEEPKSTYEAPSGSDDLPDAEKANKMDFYHGTGTKGITKKSISSTYTKIDSLLGSGVYLTDKKSVADSYATKRKGTPTTYKVKIKTKNILNMEKPLPENIRSILEKSVYSEFKEVVSSASKDSTGMDILSKLMNAISENSHDNGIPQGDYAEMFQAIEGNLREAGFEAYTHLGGLRAGKGKELHRVVVMLDPSAEYGKTANPDGTVNQLYDKGSISSVEPASASDQMTVPHEVSPNPYSALTPEQRSAQSNAILKQIDDLKDSQAKPYLDAYLGLNREPGNMTQARIVDNAMALTRMSLLGSSFFSNIPVFWTTALQAHYGGVGLIQASFRSLFGLLERVGKDDLQTWCRQTGVGTQGLLGQFASHMMEGFNGEPGGLMKNLESKFFNLVGLTPLKDMLASNYVFMLSNEMAHNAGKGFNELPERMQRHLGDYRIAPEEWDIIRKYAMTKTSGYQMLASDKIREAPPEAFAGIGGAKTKGAMANAQINTEMKLANLFRDSTDYATVEPDLKTRMLTPFVNGTRGTISGDLGRLTMQFSTWGFAHGTKVIQRQWASQSRPEFIAKVGAGLILTGIISYTARQLAQGKNPMANPELWQSDDKAKAAEAWGKMLMLGAGQSGVGGMFGDLLFSQTYANGRGAPLQMLGGPLADNITQLGQFGWDAALKGKVDGGQMLKFAQGNTPFINTWWIKPVVNYMLMYGLEEQLNPGVLHRMEESSAKAGNPYWLSPSQNAARY